MKSATVTPAELEAIRQYNNTRNRDWWARQSPEERRARRQRYALNAINRAKGHTGREKQKMNRNNGN